LFSSHTDTHNHTHDVHTVAIPINVDKRNGNDDYNDVTTDKLECAKNKYAENVLENYETEGVKNGQNVSAKNDTVDTYVDNYEADNMNNDTVRNGKSDSVASDTKNDNIANDTSTFVVVDGDRSKDNSVKGTVGGGERSTDRDNSDTSFGSCQSERRNINNLTLNSKESISASDSHTNTNTTNKQTNTTRNDSSDNINKTGISFLSWNVGGLIGKLRDPDFVNYVTSFDVCCLQETFTFPSFDFSISFDEFLVFHSPAVRLSRMGRGSGGTLLLIKKSLSEFVSVVQTNVDNMLSVRLSKTLFGCDKDVIFIGMYNHPSASPYYEGKDYECAIDELEQFLLSTLEQTDECYYLLSGDLNARIGEWGLRMEDVDDDDGLNGFENEDGLFFERHSDDKTENAFGRKLMDLCTVFGLLPLNGFFHETKHFDHRFTYMSEQGSSVIDYFFCSYEFVHFLKSLVIDTRIESSHMPVVVVVQNILSKDFSSKSEEQTFSKVNWDSSKAQYFCNFMASDYALESIFEATEMLDENVDVALEQFTRLLHEAGECMRRDVTVGGAKSKRRSKWYDRDCETLKRDARRSLARFRRTRKDVDRKVYIEKRNMYNKLLSEKKTDYYNTMSEKLLKNKNDSRLFWSTVRNLRRKPRDLPHIDINSWKEHFENVLGGNADENNNAEENVHFDDVQDFDLDQPITHDEVRKAIRS